MNIAALLEKLKKGNINLEVVKDNLVVKAPKEKLEQELLRSIKEQKRHIIDFIKRTNIESGYAAVCPVEKREYYRLSPAQKRIYILQQLDGSGTGYNLPGKIKCGFSINKERLAMVFKQLIDRHESLRTSFKIVAEEPVQVVRDMADMKFTVETFTAPASVPAGGNKRSAYIDGVYRRFIRPFDLSQAPLLRIGILDGGGKINNILLIDMHHIAADAISMKILEEEFVAAINGAELPGFRLRYRDFVLWQKKEEQQTRIKDQGKYWLHELSGELPVLNLPLDFLRPDVRSLIGNRFSFLLRREETDALKSFAQKSGSTLYMAALSIYTILLSKLGGDEDIVVGSPVAARRHPDIGRIIGMFVNTLAVRTNPTAGKSYAEYLKEVRDKTLAAFENQECPFEDLVNELLLPRETGRNPVFDVMFSMVEPSGRADDTFEDLEIDENVHKQGASKFDLTLTLAGHGDRSYCSFEYNTALFKPGTIERFARYFRRIIAEASRHPEIKIQEMEIVSQEEKRRLCREFNNTKTDYPADKTVQRLFTEQVARTPGHIALVCRNVRMSYGELANKSNRLAAALRVKGMTANTIAGIMVDRSAGMIVGILGILKSGGAFLPIDANLPAARVSYMLEDSAAAFLLTGENIYKNHEGLDRFCRLVNLDDPGLYGKKEDAACSESAVNDPLYITYTSGSTGKPKGVVIEDRSLHNFITGMTKLIPFTTNDAILSLTTISFDIFGLETLLPLTKGSKVVIGTEEEQVDAAAILALVENEKITIFQVTPSRLQLLMLEDAGADIIKPLDYLLVGGEAFPPALLEKVKPLVSGKIFNVYGPTETTIWSTAQDLSGPEPIDIGKPIANTRVYILNRDGWLLPRGVAGELYIAGDGLARGYINNPELTAEKFVTNSHITGERMYRTGDLAGFRPAGSIEFLGRLDKQVKIRGFRIELGEIENILLNHEQVKEAVVIAGNKKNDKYLCAYYVAEDKKQGAATGPAQNTNAKDSPGHTELRAYVSFRLPPYMIPSYFVQIEKMPLTANGKINRKALPEPDQPVGAAYIAPRNISEETLTQIWADVLGIEKDKLSIDGNFFELGGHSLKAAMLTARIHKKMGLKIPLDQVFINPTVMGLAESFKNTRGAEFASAQPVEKKEYYDCTYVQERFYILQQMDVASTVYNLTGIYLCEGDLEAKKLAGIFLRLIGRHDILRTSFKTVAARPVQVVHQNGAFAVDYYEKSDEDATGTIKNFIRPFDLTEAPLLRVGIERLSPGKTLLMTDVHHIIADGLSLSILMGEFFNLYNGKDAPPLKLQYKDFAAWQKNYFKTGIIKKQETFWLEKFSGEIPVLKLPLDRPRGQAMDFQGGSHKFKFDKELTAGIKNLTRQRNATLFMTLFAAYNVLLARLSRQEDIIVGVPAAGRNYPDLENIIGLFLNTLILRSNPAFAKTFGEFLEEVRQNALAVFENQDYQFEMLLKKIDIKREAGRNQLFDSVFDLQNYADTMQFPETGRSGLKFTPYEYENKTAKYDMTLYIYETGDEITLNCTYRTCLFEPATIAYIMGEYHRLMGQIVKAPGMPLGDYEIFSRKHL